MLFSLLRRLIHSTLSVILFFFLFFCSTHIVHAQELKVVYYSDNPPYQYTTAENEADGLIIDFWRLWSQKIIFLFILLQVR